MGYCRKCGNKLADDIAFCPKCGTPAVAEYTTQQVRKEAKSPVSLGVGIIVALAAAAIIIVALIAGGFLPSDLNHIVGSGHSQTQSFSIADFTAVSASSGFNVVINHGDAYSVNVTADDNLFDKIEVYNTGGTLYIQLKPVSVSTTILRAEITMPDLQSVQFSGGTTATAKGFNSTHNFTVDVSGGSHLTLTGQAADLTVTGSGGAGMDLSNFPVNNAQIDYSGGATGTINVSGRLDAMLSGGAQLYYLGNPTLGTIDASGGASIHKAS